MEVNNSGKWVYLKTRDDMEAHAIVFKKRANCDWVTKNFCGPQWYYSRVREQSGPYQSTDYVGVYLTATEYAAEIVEGMNELATELRVARQKATEGAK